MFRVLLLSMLVAACAREGESPSRVGSSAPPRLGALATMAAERHSEIAGPAGFVDTDECDSLTRSALIAAAGLPVDVRAAEDPERPGRWYRRPMSLPECFEAGESRSTISRDPLLSVMWWAWSTRDAAVVRDLWRYGEARNWVMGDDDIGGAHTILNANMIVLLAKLCGALEANCSASARRWSWLPPVWTGTAEGYVRVLETLQIALFSEIDGYAPHGGLDRLWRHAGEQPWNPLFVTALAAQGLADPAQIDARLEAMGYPNDRLPTSAEWCSGWPVEVEEAANFKSCPAEERTHSAGEIHFMVRLLTRRPIQGGW